MMRTPEQIEAIAPTSDRSAQRFPRLRDAQLEIVKRFAQNRPRIFAPGESIYRVGDRGISAWFLLEGSAELIYRDGLDRQANVQSLDAGQFTGELNQLSGRPAMADAVAGPHGCVALALDGDRVRALIIGSAEVGELIMRAFILRRVGMLERGVGPVLLGRAGSPDLLRLQAFLTRNTYPHLVLDCSSERGRQLIDDLSPPPEDLPLLVCACGRVLKRPSNEEAGAWLGITPVLKESELYDVTVVGAGPAGLATAVYAASEGLSVLVIDGQVLGGQAGASARIENYLGFPTGISGQALTGRALNQAQKFGAQVAIPLVAKGLRSRKSRLGDGADVIELILPEGSVQSKTVVVASGACYRRPTVSNLKSFEGDSIHYWASPVEARLCTGEEIVLVGAGNAAGQAIVFLAPQVERLTLIVRGAALEASMSRYLIDRIRMLPNVQVRLQSELSELHAERPGVLRGVTIRNRATRALQLLPVRHLFVFIGAEPNAAWLEGRLVVDEKGYILTGLQSPAQANTPARHALQTSVPGVFAIGDVRSGSTKRVASAVGEGAAVVAQVHSLLSSSITTA